MAHSKTIELLHEGIIRQTDEAVYFMFEEDKREWIPKSVIEHFDDDTVTIPLYIAVRKEIEEYEI